MASKSPKVPKKADWSAVSTARPSGDNFVVPPRPPSKQNPQPALSERKLSGDDYSLHEPRWSENQSHSGTKSGKRNRRSKEETGSRNFLCGCGKSYLSYPALYTHTKTKHNNVFPPGTTNLEKQGLPNKMARDDSRGGCSLQRIYSANRNLQQFLRGIPGCLDPRDLPSKYLIEDFPCEIFVQVSFYKKLLVSIEQLRGELNEVVGPAFMRRLDSVIFEINNPGRLNLYEVTALFLMHLFRFVSRTFYRDLVFLTVCLLLFLKQSGWERIGLMVEMDRPDQGTDFCEGSFAEFLPDFMDPFLTDFLRGCFTPGRVVVSTACLTFLGVGSERLFWVLGTVKFFCEFLELNRFSRARLAPL